MEKVIQSFVFARRALIGLILAASSHFVSAQVIVNIIQPSTGQVFDTPGNIVLVATVSNLSANPALLPVTNVTFYANGVSLGTANQVVLDPPGIDGVTGPVYELTWASPAPSAYGLIAVATQTGGITSTSRPVDIAVVEVGPRPVVRITSPPNHAVFFQPVDIPIFAFAAAIYPDVISNSLTAISNVEFYAGTNDLGPGHRVIKVPPDPLLPISILLPNEFTLTWSNAPAGVFALTAVATDDHGMMATSAPVDITVVPTMINTNGLDVVDIVATDPVAIQGTNCWTWPGLAAATPTWAALKTPVWILNTNCGPKEATFMVRRAGEITNDLTVAYDVGGTASNGVDFTMLSNSVTIPAGQSYAFINIVPMDTPPSAPVETIVVCLEPSTNAPPTYVVGKPPCAAAILLDRQASYPSTSVLPGSLFHVYATGPDGAWFCVQYSTDMINWSPVATNQVVNGCIDFVDPSGTAAGGGFYQAVAQPIAPSQ
jgi:hypothetical protein